MNLVDFLEKYKIVFNYTHILAIIIYYYSSIKCSLQQKKTFFILEDYLRNRILNECL